MKNFDSTHLIFLAVTISFLALSMWGVSKMSKKWQNALIVCAVVVCSGGIFYRYALGLSFEKGLSVQILIQMLQVCNFNFILLPLMLIPKCELARQYSFMFSMFAASTALISVSKSFANVSWDNPELMNYWLNHVFAIACPLWMLSARRIKPQKKYVLPVLICVFVYFTAVYGFCELLRANGIIAPDKSFSYIYDTMGFLPLDWLYNLIGVPYFYLYPLIPLAYGFFYLQAHLFRNYKLKI